MSAQNHLKGYIRDGQFPVGLDNSTASLHFTLPHHASVLSLCQLYSPDKIGDTLAPKRSHHPTHTLPSLPLLCSSGSGPEEGTCRLTCITFSQDDLADLVIVTSAELVGSLLHT